METIGSAESVIHKDTYPAGRPPVERDEKEDEDDEEHHNDVRRMKASNRGAALGVNIGDTSQKVTALILKVIEDAFAMLAGDSDGDPLEPGEIREMHGRKVFHNGK